MKTLTCPGCGARFETKAHNKIYCSHKCANRVARRKFWAKQCGSAELTDVVSASKPVTFEVLSKAKTKPANTSAIRWRMELRRRAMQTRFGQKNLDLLPHPDLI